MPPGAMRRLLPEPVAATSVDRQVAELDFVSAAGEDRPYLVTNFALTLDGKATLGGRSGAIGSATDTAMLVGLRTRADALLIGAGTMRAERYGSVVGNPAKQEQRRRAGLTARPLVVLLTSGLDLPWDAPLFSEAETEVLIWTSAEDDPPPTAASVAVERYTGTVDLEAALRRLRREHGVRALLCEGGPQVHGELIEAGLVDELFVTLAAVIGGGGGPGLVAGLPERERPLELAWLLFEEETGELFARYRVR
jgi:riboflavin biosynthesis pyrimidine reductase